MIVNDDSRVITKLETSLTDDARAIIYDRHMYIVQAPMHLYTTWTPQCAKLVRFILSGILSEACSWLVQQKLVLSISCSLKCEQFNNNRCDQSGHTVVVFKSGLDAQQDGFWGHIIDI
jgi:hypothetical protein